MALVVVKMVTLNQDEVIWSNVNCVFIFGQNNKFCSVLFWSKIIVVAAILLILKKGIV